VFLTLGAIAMAAPRRSIRLCDHDWVAFAQDALIYIGREQPSASGRPLGKPPRTVFKSAGPKVLPTKRILEMDMQRSLIDDADPLGADSMAAVIETALQCTPASESVMARDIPVSPASHDNSQLEWGRGKSVPLCSMGDSCIASLIEGSLGPLHIYLSLTEEQNLSPSSTFESPRLCVLCVRQQCALLKMSSALAGCQDIATYCPPPFKNLFNCHEGYRSNFVGALIPTADGDARIACVSDDMSVKYRTSGDGKTTWYIDQSSMIYNATTT